RHRGRDQLSNGAPVLAGAQDREGDPEAAGRRSQTGPSRWRAYFVNASAPALATCASCSDVAPDTPTAPMILPSTMSGIPPSSGLAPLSLSSRRLGPPWPTRSWNTLVGRR